ncbi:hypothetical protein GCM10011410_21630 [Hoyosella rhizosphaerae]|uniref:HTH tetR-type domain-containing protein n=1 Tax=Hoyosella rhizosphaerae TaxID=1755582 RepID=A0A916UCN1_9ACTN|nr:hypothetical protein GCM10011410_21630 [Hoyosella rhizosphaerae]
MVLRDRLIEAAREATCQRGWSAVTMAGVGSAIGVNRQAVYKEFPTKAALADAMIRREAELFFAAILETMQKYGSDIATGLPEAVRVVLDMADENQLMQAILNGQHRAELDLIDLLAVDPKPVLGQAIVVVVAEAANLYRDTGISESDLYTLISINTRLTISHLLQAGGSTDDAVHQVAWVTRRALAATVS